MAKATTGYKPTARALHWIVAIMVLATLPIGMTMTQKGLDRGLQDTLYILHKNGGVIILVFMIVRLGFRLMNPPPPLPATIAPWQERAAGITHTLLYVMVFFMALTGMIRVMAGGFPIEMFDALGIPRLAKNESIADIAQTAHFYGRFVLVLAILAHIGAALQHKFIKKDGVYERIWPIFPR